MANNLRTTNNTLSNGFRNAAHSRLSNGVPGLPQTRGYAIGRSNIAHFGSMNKTISKEEVDKKISKVEKITSKMDLSSLHIAENEQADFSFLFGVLAINLKGIPDSKTNREMTLKRAYKMLPEALKLLQDIAPEGTTNIEKIAYLLKVSKEFQSPLYIKVLRKQYENANQDDKTAMKTALLALSRTVTNDQNATETQA